MSLGQQTLPTPTKALVLSSGGVDSTTCLAVAIDQMGIDNVAAVSMFYGQRHSKELQAAQAVAEYYGVAQRVLDISSIFAGSNSSLLAGSTQEIPHGEYAQQMQRDDKGMVSTYVPFRNGLMLSAAAALAMSLFPDDVCALYLGAHADDAAGDVYPDCSPEFTQAMGQAISRGTYHNVQLAVPFVHSTKAQVVACGLQLGAPYHLTWSCYEGDQKACGVCGTCLDRLAAFRANGVQDPIAYQ